MIILLLFTLIFEEDLYNNYHSLSCTALPNAYSIYRSPIEEFLLSILYSNIKIYTLSLGSQFVVFVQEREQRRFTKEHQRSKIESSDEHEEAYKSRDAESGFYVAGFSYLTVLAKSLLP